MNAIIHDDPAYDNLSEFEKDLGYNIPYNFGSADTKFLHVPGAFELYQFAGVAPVKLLQAYKEQDPERFTDYMNRFILNWGASLVLHRFSDTYRITGETMANYSLFYKNNIVNQNNQRFLGPWQTTSYTSEIAKTIAKKINVSAGKVDYMIRQTTGGIGRNVLDLTDYLAKKTGKNKDDVYFDDTELVYKDKTVLRNAETKTVYQMLKSLRKEEVNEAYLTKSQINK